MEVDLQPEDERTALLQRLEQYRAIATGAVVDLDWEQASTRLLPATDLTIAGIVKHLAWAEDRWFQGRLLGVEMPAPWRESDDPDSSMRLGPGDSVNGIVELSPGPWCSSAWPQTVTLRHRGRAFEDPAWW